MGEKGIKSKKRVYGFIAITLVFSVCLFVFLSLMFSAKIPVQAQKSDAQLDASSPVPESSNTSSPPTQLPRPIPLINSWISPTENLNTSQGGSLCINVTLSSSAENEIIVPFDILAWQGTAFPVFVDYFDATFEPNPLVLEPNETKSCILTLRVANNTPPGDYKVRIETGNWEVTHVGSIGVFPLTVTPYVEVDDAQPASLMTEEEALRIAMPPIEQYARENNRTITTVNATFFAGNSRQPRPEWGIYAKFEGVEDRNAFQHWIIGYAVSIWADNGEIKYANEQGIM